MQIDSGSLKELMKSTYAPTCGGFIMDKIREGEIVEIVRDDLTIVRLTNVEEATRLLGKILGLKS